MTDNSLLSILTQSGSTGLIVILTVIIYRLVDKRFNNGKRDLNSEFVQSIRSLRDSIQRLDTTIATQTTTITTQTTIIHDVIQPQLTRIENKLT